MDSKKIVLAPDKLWAADEKGCFETTSGLKYVVSGHSGSGGTANAPSVTFKHISILSLLSCSRHATPPRVVVSAQRWHPKLKQVYLEACVCKNAKGSMTSELFRQCCHEAWYENLSKELKAQRKMLLLDSGGGSWCHVSAVFVMFCVNSNVRPTLLHAYTTKALMPLHQMYHRMLRQRWSE